MMLELLKRAAADMGYKHSGEIVSAAVKGFLLTFLLVLGMLLIHPGIYFITVASSYGVSQQIPFGLILMYGLPVVFFAALANYLPAATFGAIMGATMRSLAGKSTLVEPRPAAARHAVWAVLWCALAGAVSFAVAIVGQVLLIAVAIQHFQVAQPEVARALDGLFEMLGAMMHDTGIDPNDVAGAAVAMAAADVLVVTIWKGLAGAVAGAGVGWLAVNVLANHQDGLSRRKFISSIAGVGSATFMFMFFTIHPVDLVAFTMLLGLGYLHYRIGKGVSAEKVFKRLIVMVPMIVLVLGLASRLGLSAIIIVCFCQFAGWYAARSVLKRHQEELASLRPADQPEPTPESTLQAVPDMTPDTPPASPPDMAPGVAPAPV